MPLFSAEPVDFIHREADVFRDAKHQLCPWVTVQVLERPRRQVSREREQRVEQQITICQWPGGNGDVSLNDLPAGINHWKSG